ncbi:MAG TPA: DUF4163 domain-containing protein [Xanthobacteraceae bacterium]|jgi:hypothetical protein
MTKVAMIDRFSSSPAHLRVKVSLIVAALVLASVTVLAADAKSDFALKTKYIDAKVMLDRALKSNTALAADSLAEGKRWVEKNHAEAAKEFKASPELFRDGRAWTFERSYTQASLVDGRYVSVVRTDYIYTGGAHPNTDIDTILWDDSAKKRISIRPFFKETADDGPTLKALRDASITAVKTEKKARNIPDSGEIDWYKDVEPKLLKVGAVTLAASSEPGKSSGLEFHYPPYAVGSYAEGPFDVFVPWETFKSYLSPQGVAIFAGDLPADTKQDK